MFSQEELSLGAALELCKLQAGDQKYVFEQYTNEEWPWRSLKDWTVKELSSSIQNNFHIRLDKALFDPADPKIIKKAGPCTTCPKNTACNKILFPGESEKATCTDPKCFNQKTNHTFDKLLAEALEDPEVVLIYAGYSDLSRVNKLKADGHRLYKDWDDFNTVSKPEKPEWSWYEPEYDEDPTEEEREYDLKEAQEQFKEAQQEYEQEMADYAKEKYRKGFWVNSAAMGRIVDINLKTASGNAADSNLSTNLEALKQKLKRGRELDAEKVQKKISDDLFTESFFTDEPLIGKENRVLTCLVFDQLQWSQKISLAKRLGYDGKDDWKASDYAKDRIQELTEKDFAYMVRLWIHQQYRNAIPPGHGAEAVRSLALHYIPEQIAKHELDQEGIRDRREERLNQRIKQLEEEIKEQAHETAE